MSENDKKNLPDDLDEFGGFDAEFGGFDFDADSPEKGGLDEAVEAPQEALEAPVEPEGGEDTPEPPEADTEPSEAAYGPSEDESLSIKTPKLAKRARKPLSKREKALRVILRRAGLEELPPLEQIVKGKDGQRLRVSDIALFIGDPEDATLAVLAAECPLRNRVNLSAEVTKSRVVSVGAQILEAGRMYTPIQVARIYEVDSESTLECTSGRHRLAFLALAYGPDAEIPVYIEEMTLNEARDATVVANQARPTKALERAEHAVLQAVGGDAEAEQDELYAKTAVTKAKARKYCVYSVVQRGYPIALSFPISLGSSRKGDALTTLTNVENFLGGAVKWEKEMPRKEFDAGLKKAVKFLNALVAAMQKEGYFEPVHHLAAMTMSAMGKYYGAYCDMNSDDPMGIVESVAEAVVEMGEIGRQKSEQTYNALAKAMRS